MLKETASAQESSGTDLIFLILGCLCLSCQRKRVSRSPFFDAWFQAECEFRPGVWRRELLGS